MTDKLTQMKEGITELAQAFVESQQVLNKSINNLIEILKDKQEPIKKFGYVSINYVPEGRSGDYVVYENGFALSHLSIQRANDIEGWYEYITRERGDLGYEYSKVHHVKANIEIKYFPDKKEEVSKPKEDKKIPYIYGNNVLSTPFSMIDSNGEMKTGTFHPVNLPANNRGYFLIDNEDGPSIKAFSINQVYNGKYQETFHYL